VCVSGEQAEVRGRDMAQQLLHDLPLLRQCRGCRSTGPVLFRECRKLLLAKLLVHIPLAQYCDDVLEERAGCLRELRSEQPGER
jgi:hypothetical protein